MRTTLAAIVLTIALAAPGLAAAGGVILGWRPCLGCAVPPPVVAYPYGYAAPYYPQPPYYFGPPYVPYAADRSYFRPYGPYGWNMERNWRDTWQDDGVKVHGYTFR